MNKRGAGRAIQQQMRNLAEIRRAHIGVSCEVESQGRAPVRMETAQ